MSNILKHRIHIDSYAFVDNLAIPLAGLFFNAAAGIVNAFFPFMSLETHITLYPIIAALGTSWSLYDSTHINRISNQRDENTTGPLSRSGSSGPSIII